MAKLRKDGTPDKRYKKNPVIATVAGTLTKEELKILYDSANDLVGDGTGERMIKEGYLEVRQE
ncbi:MAG: hypothetical protein NUV65_03035, partial [Candidatus Roizmanbacteria bacterium]|nr:hypothetical protein [Candidatus Roizmanbacteria bacterium]